MDELLQINSDDELEQNTSSMTSDTSDDVIFKFCTIVCYCCRVSYKHQRSIDTYLKKVLKD